MIKFFFFLILHLFFISCETSDSVTPGHIATDIRPVGLKCDPVEFWPGESVEMKLFLAGRDFSQDSDLPVKWLFSDQLTLPYHTPFSLSIPENIEDLISSEIEGVNLPDVFENLQKKGYIDIPLTAEINIPVPGEGDRSRNILTTKIVRIHAEEPIQKRKNPEITEVSLYHTDKQGKIIEASVQNSGNIVFYIDKMPDVILFKTTVENSTEDDDSRLTYSWTFTSDTSMKLKGNIDLELDESKFHDMMEEKQRATPNRKYMALNFKNILEEIKENDIELPLKFNFYSVVREKAADPADASEYRWGLDFFFFTFVIDHGE